MIQWKNSSLLLICLIIIIFDYYKSSSQALQIEQQQNIQQISFIQIRQEEKDKSASDGEAPQPSSQEQPTTLTEADVRKIIKEETEPLKQEIKSANEEINKEMAKIQNEFKKTMNKTLQNITKTVDKMARHLDKKVTKLQEAVEGNVKQTSELSILILDSQIQDKEEQLKQLNLDIAKLKYELPALDDECDGLFTCEECTGNPLCGWCQMEEQCVKGDNIGPLYIHCNFYDYKVCRGKNCAKYVDCESCISDPICGWCNDDVQHVEGCIEEGPEYQGCPIEGWFHIEGNNNRCTRQINESKDPLQNQQQERKWENNTSENEDGEQNPSGNTESQEDYLSRQKQIKKWEQEQQTDQNKQLENRKKGLELRTPAERRSLYDKKKRELQQKSLKASKLKQEIENLKSKLSIVQQQLDEYSGIKADQKATKIDYFKEEGEGEGEDNEETQAQAEASMNATLSNQTNSTQSSNESNSTQDTTQTPQNDTQLTNETSTQQQHFFQGHFKQLVVKQKTTNSNKNKIQHNKVKPLTANKAIQKSNKNHNEMKENNSHHYNNKQKLNNQNNKNQKKQQKEQQQIQKHQKTKHI